MLLNTPPLNYSYGTIVESAHRGNVDPVFVAGRLEERNSTLLGLDLDDLNRLVNAARHGLINTAHAAGVGLIIDHCTTGFGIPTLGSEKRLRVGLRPTTLRIRRRKAAVGGPIPVSCRSLMSHFSLYLTFDLRR